MSIVAKLSPISATAEHPLRDGAGRIVSLEFPDIYSNLSGNFPNFLEEFFTYVPMSGSSFQVQHCQVML